MKRNMLVAACLSIVLFLSACGEGEVSPSPSSSPSDAPPSATVSSTPAPTPEPVLNPLTGLPVNPDYVSRRPVAVMINNLRIALPQLGISKADLLYEIVAEGGITRIVAVFQDPSIVGEIGTVRSTRNYYLDVAQGLDAILLHAGASEMAYAEIPKRGVTALDAVRGGYEGSLYYRDAARRKNAGLEHSMFTSGERIEEIIANAKFRTEHEEGYAYPILFEAGAVLRGDSAARLSVKFSNVKTGVFDYDEETKEYFVSQYGKPHTDGEVQISVRNVLVLRATTRLIPGDEYGRLDVTLVGEGTGYYAVNGKVNEIVWSKASQNDPFVYTYPNGDPVKFEPGKTYINIVSASAAVEVE